MLDCLVMEMIHQLEEQFDSLSQKPTPQMVLVVSRGQDYELRLPQLGEDFVAGLIKGLVLVIPSAQVSQIRGPNLPATSGETLSDFLARQRTPIRVHLSTNDSATTCWLLNVEDGWLRVAQAHEVIWVPIEAIKKLEIVAVDNSNQ